MTCTDFFNPHTAFSDFKGAVVRSCNKEVKWKCAEKLIASKDKHVKAKQGYHLLDYC
eukprot:m.168429 g.168429  ORF g.168429 m.168429 type:complete len:57 (+) comp38953_c1_seq51:143-313(+)